MADREIIGWPNAPTEGYGVWITERLRFDAYSEVSVRDRKLIYPVPRKPRNWREDRSLITSRVQEIIPAARLIRYGGGVARLETPESTIEAYIGGYDASRRRS
jgi:hypothetical protein